jgi:eukaryotic-like serine/threonine-protein kinase
MSSSDALSDSITRVIADEVQTIEPQRAPAGLSMVARRLFREPLDPIRLSRYILLEPLGQGAFGAVYAAYDPELNRKVAIKLLVPRDGSTHDLETGRDRLLREAQAMAHFSHPNVVAVYDVGAYSLPPSIREEVSEVVRDGVFVVMELVDGKRFDHWARARKRSWREIVTAAVAAAKGLAAAHDAGLVHRDFKPANVLVDDHGHPKILDFGLARLQGEGPSSLVRGPSSEEVLLESVEGLGRLGDALTRTGTVLGTPRYMAPEQHRGDEAHAKSDQYAFCVTLYELLYGGSPFHARKFDELVRAKLRVDTLRPPTSEAPPWLFRVLRRGLDPDPERRFASMHALIAALERDPARVRRRLGLGVGLVVVAVATSWGVGRLGQAVSPCADHAAELAGVWDLAVAERAQAAFGATGLPHAEQSWRTVSTSLATWAEGWVAERVALCEAARRPDAPSAEAQGKRLLCLERHRRRTAGLTRVLGNADPEVVAAAGLMASELEPPQACAQLAAPSPATTDLAGAEQAEEAVAEAVALLAVQKDRAAVEAAERAMVAVEAVPGEHLRARARLVLAQALLGDDRPKEARDEVQAAIELAERVGDDELACEGLVVLFRALADAGDHAGADLVARLASSRAEAAMVGDRVAAMLSYHLGVVRLREGRWAEARPHLQRARELRERLHGPTHPLVAEADNALAVSLHRDGKRDEALPVFMRALATFEAALGPDHPQLAKVHNNLGNYWMVAGRYDEAYRELSRSAAINAANYSPDHLAVATADYNLALVAQAQGQRRKALEHLERAGRVRQKQRGEDHPDTLSVRSTQAKLLDDLGRAQEATVLTREVLAAKTRTLGRDHPETLDTAMHLAHVLVENEQVDEGLPLAEQTIARAESVVPGSDDLGRWLVTMARILGAVGRKAEAEQAVGRALELLRFESGETSPILTQAYLVQGDLALARGDTKEAEASTTSAITLMTNLFGPEHGRLASPLQQRAAARRAAGDVAGARADLERAVRLSVGYEGPPLQRAKILLELAQALPPAEGERIAALLAEARGELAGVRAQALPGFEPEVAALERAIAARQATGSASGKVDAP